MSPVSNRRIAFFGARLLALFFLPLPSPLLLSPSLSLPGVPWLEDKFESALSTRAKNLFNVEPFRLRRAASLRNRSYFVFRVKHENVLQHVLAFSGKRTHG